MMMKRVTFLIVIDSYLLRKGITSLLNKIPGINIIRECSSLSHAEKLLVQEQPDYMIISRSLYEQASHLYNHHAGLPQKTILLEYNRNASGKPVQSTLYMDDSREQLTLVLNNLVNPYFKEPPKEEQVLSKREITILKHIARGYTNKEIADHLFLSLHTVTTHRKNIVAKLGIKSVSGLTVYAIVNDLISLEEIARGGRE